MSNVTKYDQVLITQGHLLGATAIVMKIGTARKDRGFAVIEVMSDTSEFVDKERHWLPTNHMMLDPDFSDE